MRNKDYLSANRRTWDEWADIHIKGSSFYPVEQFKAGKQGWRPNIPDDIGPVTGKSMLHLLCHFGMDTIMWAGQGAQITGVDFSEKAINHARSLNHELGKNAEFIRSDIYQLPKGLDKQFDILLTYYGTVMWLPDLPKWAKVIAHFLKPGGFFYLADAHPFVNMLSVDKNSHKPQIGFPYFTTGKPERIESKTGTYANPGSETTNKVTYQWDHSLSKILDAIIDAGLQIEYLHEFPFSFYNVFYYADTTLMNCDKQGWWRFTDIKINLPLMFSIKAVKPDESVNPYLKNRKSS